MDRRTLLFFVISATILLVYQEFVINPQMPAPVAVGDVAEQTVTPGETVSEDLPITVGEAAPLAPESIEPLGAAQKEPKAPIIPGRRIQVETDLYRATLNTRGGRLESFVLKNFREDSSAESPELELVVPAPEIENPLGIELRGARVWSDQTTLYNASQNSVSVNPGETGRLVLRATIGGQPIEKEFTFHAGLYTIDLTTRVPGSSALPVSLAQDGPDGSPPAVALTLSRGAKPKEDGTVYEGVSALIDGKLESTPREDFEEPETITGTIGWAGFEDHYFLTAAAPERADALRLRRRGAKALQAGIVTSRNASGPTETGYTLYFGPKERSLLEGAGHQYEKALNLGWFGPISLLLLDILQFLHRIFGNWGVDIILLTVLVKAVFWPLSKKSFDSMKAMQKLQPEMEKIKERHADDQQKLSQETMELYKRHKVNPLGGCLPMLLQMPVFFGLYQLLQNTIELRHAPFALWITDLAAPERLMIAGYGIPVLTLLLGASMFLQQKMTPSAADPTQQKIMMLMPVVFTFMFINFPAGLTLYWLTQNILTIGQQWLNLRTPET
jgi:YidC/Oxa1 family membrane protein insertase